MVDVTGRWIERLDDPVGVAVRLANMGSSTAGSDCWLWKGAVNHGGYGQIRLPIEGRMRGTSPHRLAWLAYRGELPQGLVIDHLCRVRRCFNPWHLDPVPAKVNTGRGTPTRHGCRTHGFDDGYYQTDERGYECWACRPCRLERTRRSKARRAATVR